MIRAALLSTAGLLGLALLQAPAGEWTPATSGVTARLRGVSAVSDRVIWASGADGTIIRTADSGVTWQRLTIPDTAGLDFRDIDALSESVAYVLSIGPGDRSRIYKTADAGRSWTPQFVNTDATAFFDAMAFWDERRGVAFSDAAAGRFHVITTSDGGASWQRVPAANLPPALDNEGAFAASGTNVAVHGTSHVWIGTGAAAQARVLRSTDGGQTWDVSATPLAAGPTTGIFSIAFRDALHGMVVGGDYAKEGDAVRNAAVTTDGGRTWTLVEGLTGFRSVVQYLPEGGPGVIAVGPSGADYSPDGGRTWRAAAGPGFHAFSAAPGGRLGVGVGEGGRAGLWTTSAAALSAPVAAQLGPVVVLAPHPDDETLGCGGLIARRAAEGRRVVVVVVTDGRALLARFGIDRDPSQAEVSRMRKEETRRALDILTDGRVELVFLDFENERLLEQQAEATRRITALLNDLKPAELYVTSPFEGHREHLATNEIARVACTATGSCGAIVEYIVTLKAGTSVDDLPRRRIRVDVSAYRDREQRALAQFRSHLDVISPRLSAPLTPNYDRYLTDEEPFLVER